jgi:hypothetical protein
MNRRDDPIEARKQVEREQKALRKLMTSERLIAKAAALGHTWLPLPPSR